VSSYAFEHARQQWEEGHRRFEADARDSARATVLYEQLEVVLGEIRRRVGETFGLAELAAAYADAEDWAREVVEERAASPGWARNVALVTDAAFHVYARGATDYRP
jgi:hypothetical protein